MRIEVKNITFSYRMHTVLRGLDFLADAGDIIAVLGPNGVGKSTFFRCLLGFLKPQTGGIYINGKNIQAMKAVEIAQSIAYIPQSAAAAFNYTVREIVLMGLTNRLGAFESPGQKEIEKVNEVMNSLNMSHLRYRGFGQISGGERQLALLARALAQSARVLVMDEPTANLDYGNSWRVMERVAGLAAQNYTVIFSTHDPNHAFMHANKVFVMKGGGVLAAGAPKESLTEELLSQLYNIDVMVRPITCGGEAELISLPRGRGKK